MRGLITLFFGVAVACQALPTFTVNFSPSTESGTPGNMVTFFMTLTNNTGNTEFINSDVVGGLPGIPLANIDDLPFLSSAPLSLAPNGNSGPIPFAALNITIPVSASGSYAGTFDIFGGEDGGNGTGNTFLGEGAFTLQVTSVPEPAPVLLFGAGLSAIFFFARRPRRLRG